MCVSLVHTAQAEYCLFACAPFAADSLIGRPVSVSGLKNVCHSCTLPMLSAASLLCSFAAGSRIGRRHNAGRRSAWRPTPAWICPSTFQRCVMSEVGQNRISVPYMTVCMMISFLTIPYVHSIPKNRWFWPILLMMWHSLASQGHICTS